MLKPKNAWKVQQVALQRSLLGITYPPPGPPGWQRSRRNAKKERATVVDPLPVNKSLSATISHTLYHYKAATDFVAVWLVNTAKARGYSIDLLTTNDGSDDKGNGNGNGNNNNNSQDLLEGLLGKADGDTAASSTAKKTASQLKHAHKIPIHNFVKLARFIAKASDPPVKVPRKLVKALDKAIAIRRNHTAQVISQVTYDTHSRRSLFHHFHFASILEHVRIVLQPRMPKVRVREKQTGDIEEFDAQESSEWILEGPDITMTRNGADATFKFKVNYDTDLRLNMEEAYLGFDRLMQDFRSLRTVLHQAWKGYQLGTFDLVTVSLMTNASISVARKLQEGVQKLFDKHHGSSKMLGAFYAASCAVYGEDPAFRERPGDDLNFRMYDLADSMMLPTQMLLQSFGALVEPGNILPYKPGHYGTFDPASDRSEKCARERFQEDRIVLLEILSVFLMFHRVVPSQPFEDEFTRGLRLMFDTHDTPIWLVFAAHVFLDIHHALRGHATKGFSDLKVYAGSVDASIKANLEFHSSLTTAEWPKGYGEFFATVQDIHTWVDSDPVEEQKARLQARPWEMFKYMEWNPLFCGMFNHSLKCAYQELSLSFQGACIRHVCANTVQFGVLQNT